MASFGKVLRKPAIPMLCLVSLPYLYLGMIVTRVVNLPLEAKSVLALPSFYLLPLLVGVVLDNLAHLEEKVDLSFLSSLVVDYIVGVLAMEAMAAILQIANAGILLQNIGFLFLSFSSLGLLFLFGREVMSFLRKGKKSLSRKHVVSILSIFLTSLTAFFLKLSFVPAPFTVWNAWANPIAQVQGVLRLWSSGFFDITQRWFDILFATTSCQLFNIGAPEYFGYTATLLVTFVAALGVNLLVYKLTSNLWASLLCGCMSIFLNIPSGLQSAPVYQFKSNSILISLSMWFLLPLTELLEKSRENSSKSLLSSIICVSLPMAILAFMTSFLVIGLVPSFGISYETYLALVRPLVIVSFILISLATAIVRRKVGLGTFLLMVFLTVYTMHDTDSLYYMAFLIVIVSFSYLLRLKRNRAVLTAISLTMFSLILLAWNGLINIPDLPISTYLGYGQPSTTSSFLVKKIVFSDGNTSAIRYLFMIGVVALIFSRSYFNKASSWFLGTSSLTVSFGLFFFPDYWLVRVMDIATPFMAMAITSIPAFVLDGVGFLHKWRGKSRVLISAAIIGLFLFSVVPNLQQPLVKKLSEFPPSKVASYEYDAALWLRQNTNETATIVSDYWTMMLLNPLSNKVWITNRMFISDDLDQWHKQLLSDLKTGVFDAAKSSQAYQGLESLIGGIEGNLDWTEQYYLSRSGIQSTDLTFLIVLSSRTIQWLYQSSLDVDAPQYGGVDSKHLSIFDDSNYFLKVYEVPGQLYVFKTVVGRVR
ncbi:hypothetical protein MUP05_00375 [Candidatus Bathyarchaeota archaeon]|nr:hypothetical protein [Candidatus Bathyarchaeota archaeon]